MNRHLCGVVRIFFLGVACCIYLAGQSASGDSILPEESNYRVGVWSLKFTNRISEISSSDLANILEISSNLVVSVRDGTNDISVEGVVLQVQPGTQSVCDVTANNITTRYELSCAARQIPFAAISLHIYENINLAGGKYFAARDIIVTTDGQPNLLPCVLDDSNKSDLFRFVAINKDG